MTDDSSGVLGDFILGEVTVLIFVGDLSLMILELLFLLVIKWDARFPFGLLKMTSLVFIDSIGFISWPWSVNVFVVVKKLKILSLVTGCFFCFSHDWLLRWFYHPYSSYVLLAFCIYAKKQSVK